MEKQVRHRPGALKHQNKTHKNGKHRSKGEIRKENKGKVESHAIKRRAKDEMSKADRKNRQQQLRKQKREEILNSKRCIGSFASTPLIISIIALSNDVNVHQLVDLLIKSDKDAKTWISNTNIVNFNSSKLKMRFNFITPNSIHLDAILNTIKVSDTCIFLVPVDKALDEFGLVLYDTIYASKMPKSVFVTQGDSINSAKNTNPDLIKFIEQKSIDAKIYHIQNEFDASKFLYQVSQHKLNDTSYHNIRPYVVAQKYDYIQDSEKDNNGSLVIYGYLRGNKLNPNNLVYLPSVGTFQVDKIDVLLNHPSDEVEKGQRIMQTYTSNPDKIESLEMHAEQAQSIDEEFPIDDDEVPEIQAQKVRKLKKLVPKGTSEYQAAWILNADEEVYEDESTDEEEDNKESEGEEEEMNTNQIDEQEDNEQESDVESMEELQESKIQTERSYDDEIDLNEEQIELDKIRKAKEDKEFPDEVDTPVDVPARVRFQKYRGLKSFRTSPWNQYEDLPTQYSKIFQFENFKRTCKKLLNTENEGVEAGSYVAITLKNVPKFDLSPNYSLTLQGLLKFENKLSVAHFALRRVNKEDYSLPIKSKEKLIFYCGIRKFEATALFSQHSNGDKHKYERFMPDNGSFVATIMAPITYPPASVLAYKEREDGSRVLIAVGSLLTIDPNRIILKRIVLSGFPYKVFQSKAVIRYMFFNPDDIEWFKPIELRTKMGRIGHIKEPLGTHGHMKCQFNNPIKAHDIILMSLYKRVYPTINYKELVDNVLDENSNKMSEI